MYRYTFLNLQTKHVFFETDDLKDLLNFYHKVPRRLTHDLAIQDNETGELVRIKYAKNRKEN